MIRFSIFLPVHNGMPYVAECIQSILEQSYRNFELHVLDNHSTDGTTEWLKTLTDPRIRLGFSDVTLSIVESWRRVKCLPKADFITLIGHDDILDKNFLKVICDLINSYPDAGLYQTGGRLINSDGCTIRTCRAVPSRETASDYLAARFAFKRDVFGTGYVMRSSDYDRVGGIPPFEKLFFADDALWLSLLIGSYKACDPTEHFAVRIHSGSESASLPSAWRSILRGLNQFMDFLRCNVIHIADGRFIFDSRSDNFLLAYHRNAMILALVEASQGGQGISPEVTAQIETSLARCAPSQSGALWKSPKLCVLRLLNATPARGLIPVLWKQYYRLKNKAN